MMSHDSRGVAYASAMEPSRLTPALQPVAATLLMLVVGAGLVFTLVSCRGVEVAPERQLDSYSTRQFAEVLQASVRDGLVDYSAVAQREKQLDVYLDALERFGPRTTPEQFPTRESELAYYLNAYNAFMLKRWVDAGAASVDPSKDVNRLWFVTDQWKLDGRSLTMDSLEQRVIRPEFEEPRIHFALVCGAQSCPPLMGKPFDADKLDEQLDSLGRTWLGQPDGLRVSDSGQVRMSKIFDWYGKDFEAMGGLAGVIEKYVPSEDPRKRRALEAARNGEIKFMDYDWSINTVRAAR